MISITQLLALISFVLVVVFFWAKHHFSYWRRQNVAFVEPNFLFGNFKDMFTLTKNCADVIEELYYHKNAKDQPVLGIYIFNKPALLIRAPELIKSILVKNFQKFSDRHANCDTECDILGSSILFFIKNPQWKELRTKLAPVFSSGKIREIFSLIQDVGNNLDHYLCATEPNESSQSFTREVKEICVQYTTDVIANVAFGIRTNSLKNPEDKFRRVGRKILDFNLWRSFQFVFLFFLPNLTKFFRCKFIPKDSETFFRATINSVMEERIQSSKTRNDLIDVLVEFKKTALVESSKNIGITMNNDILVAQAAAFFVAGFETSATAMSFCLYELSKNPKIQERLREEIRKVLVRNGDGNLTYDDVNEIEYMDAVIMETLRLHPSLPFLDRICTLPLDEENFSLKPICNFAIPNNMPVYIPKIALHKDPKFFPNPEKFDPERFSPTNKINIQAGTFVPFGLGPRNCIGYRFGLIQTKIGIISILRNHYVATCDKTPQKIELDPRAMFIQSKGGIFCKFFRDPLI